MAQPVALVLGSGKNVGAATVQALSTNGVRIVWAARSTSLEGDDSRKMSLQCDFNKRASVAAVFEKVRNLWDAPSVEFYDAYKQSTLEAEELLKSFTENFADNLTVNTTSPFIALQQSIAGFRTLPAGIPKTFICTANMANAL